MSNPPEEKNLPRKRQVRELEAGGTYHVMARGVRRLRIADDRHDYVLFCAILQHLRQKYPYEIHSLCMMTNHFHILLTTVEDTELPLLMKELMFNYARNYNLRHGFSGHLFEKRYTSSIVRDDIYFAECSRYIHLNPVKAGMVADPLDYEFSSYSAIVNSTPDTLLSRKRLLGLFHNSPQQYRIFVEGKISHKEQELMIRSAMREDENWLPW